MSAVLRRMSSSVVRVCTFNLFRSEIDEHASIEWSKRRPILEKCLEHMQPTIIGTQEGYPPQLNDIRDDLNRSSNRWSWVGDEIDTWQTINAIFYRHDLFNLKSTNTFWFNDHPSKHGAAWGAKHSRGCTRAELQHIESKQPFIIYNLHLDFPSQDARHHSIPVLLSHIDKLDSREQVIVTGDFNNWPEQVDGDTPLDKLIPMGQQASEIRQMKEAGFVDTHAHGETPSFNGFRSAGYGPKIDFVWITSNSVYSVQGETKVDDYHDSHGFFPSDHFPVYADLIRCSA